MGYETSFNLTWEKQKEFKDIPNCPHTFTSAFCPECGTAKGVVPLSDAIAVYIEDHTEMRYAIDLNGASEESCKWYEHDTDMIEMSKDFPNVLFKLHGEGEEVGDIWDSYYLNGKSQDHKAKIMIDECNPKGWK